MIDKRDMLSRVHATVNMLQKGAYYKYKVKSIVILYYYFYII